MTGQRDDKNRTDKRSASARKVEANRRNALKSTGPKTARGKAYSGRNAIKHGLFSRPMMEFFLQGDDEIIVQLQNLAKELEETDEISPGLKGRISAIGAEFNPTWKLLETTAQERLAESGVARMYQKATPEERSWALALHTVTLAISFLKGLGQNRSAAVHEITIAQHIIPDGNALERILRYEAAIERQLSRAVDRLERLQRQRNGEMIPPPVSVRLTRS